MKCILNLNFSPVLLFSVPKHVMMNLSLLFQLFIEIFRMKEPTNQSYEDYLYYLLLFISVGDNRLDNMFALGLQNPLGLLWFTCWRIFHHLWMALSDEFLCFSIEERLFWIKFYEIRTESSIKKTDLTNFNDYLTFMFMFCQNEKENSANLFLWEL